MHTIVDNNIKIEQKLIIKLCEKALSLDINNADAYHYLGNAFYIYGSDSQKDNEQALKYYQKYSESEPDDFEIHSSIAECIKLTKDTDTAIKYIDNLIEKYPDRYEPYYCKANFLADKFSELYIDNNLTSMENTKNLIESLIQKTLELAPKDSFLYDDIAMIYEFQLEDKESILNKNI